MKVQEIIGLQCAPLAQLLLFLFDPGIDHAGCHLYYPARSSIELSLSLRQVNLPDVFLAEHPFEDMPIVVPQKSPIASHDILYLQLGLLPIDLRKLLAEKGLNDHIARDRRREAYRVYWLAGIECLQSFLIDLVDQGHSSLQFCEGERTSQQASLVLPMRPRRKQKTFVHQATKPHRGSNTYPQRFAQSHSSDDPARSA